MKSYIQDKGFTKIELVVILVVFWLFSFSMLARFTKDKDKAKESEVRANIHQIQVAIERYEVDQKRYPSFLLGGDAEGWNRWHQVKDEPNPDPTVPSNNLVQDVLVQFGYIASYPKNPFVDDGMTVIMSTSLRGSGPGGALQAGDGDPRFGYAGNIMGNGLDDPAFYKHRTIGIPPIVTSSIEIRRTLDLDTAGLLQFCEPPVGVHYMMGGRKAFDKRGNVITVTVWWPGNFFYRGAYDHPLQRKGSWAWYDPGTIPGGPKMNRYILGGYGSLQTPGFDVIRLEGRNWDNTDDVYYRPPPPWYKYARSSGIRCSYALESTGGQSEGGLPEVFGGGDAFTGPFNPPNGGDESDGYKDGEFIYGAPDGHPDGVIIVRGAGGGSFADY